VLQHYLRTLVKMPLVVQYVPFLEFLGVS
jgi:hypothetical protein